VANSRDILLKLVRIAMGWENDFSLPKDVNWKEILNLAREQGVEAIAIDGLEICKTQDPQLLSKPDYKQLLLEAIGGLQMIEFNNLHQLSSLVSMASVLSAKDIPFVVMKGFACSHYYPIPKHRGCGDIDIYPGEKYDESNQVLKDAGYQVDPYYYRHSAVMVNEVMVENHRILCDLRGPRRQTREFEKHLKAEAQKSLVSGKKVVIDGHEIEGARYPLANFNVLFLPWHVSAHFAFERVTLRHLLDWALFLVHDGKDIDVIRFRRAKNKYTYGYSKLVDILTNLSMRYLKMPASDIPLEILEDAINFDDRLADKVFDYMFVGQPRERDDNVWIFRWNNVKRVWKERWKYNEIYNQSFLSFLCHKAIGVFFKVGEDEK